MLILISCPCLARIFLINGRDSEHHKLSSRLTIASHHHRLVHPLETVYLSETNNHCKNFEETFLKTSRTVWVITWWVEESWCLRLHKVRCCYDLHCLKWKPWVIQLKPGSGAAAAGGRRGQFLLTNLFDYLHETETAASRRGGLRRITANMELRWRHYTSTTLNMNCHWEYHAYLEWNIFIIPYILYPSDILNTDWGELEI